MICGPCRPPKPGVLDIIAPLQIPNSARPRERLHRLGLERHKRKSRGLRFMADGSKRVFTVNGPAHKIYYEIVGKHCLGLEIDESRL